MLTFFFGRTFILLVTIGVFALFPACDLASIDQPSNSINLFKRCFGGKDEKGGPGLAGSIVDKVRGAIGKRKGGRDDKKKKQCEGSNNNNKPTRREREGRGKNDRDSDKDRRKKKRKLKKGDTEGRSAGNGEDKKKKKVGSPKNCSSLSSKPQNSGSKPKPSDGVNKPSGRTNEEIINQMTIRK